MNTVKLYGRLAEVFGAEFRLDCFSPAEAFRALNAQLPNWLGEIRQGDYYLIREMPNGEFAVDEKTLFMGMKNTTIHILPVAEGASKKGVGKIILGVGLIAASVFIPGAGAAIGGIMGSMTYASVGIALGLGLLLGGAAMLLSPTPKIDDKEKDDRSFLFSGDIQTAGQGIAVPITYGRDRVRPIPVATVVVTNQVSVSGSGGIFKGFFDSSDNETEYDGDGGAGDNATEKGGSSDSSSGGYTSDDTVGDYTYGGGGGGRFEYQDVNMV